MGPIAVSQRHTILALGNDILLLVVQDSRDEADFSAAWWTGDGDESTRVFRKPSLDVFLGLLTVFPSAFAYCWLQGFCR
jgi:hypothetical protein